MPCCLVWGVCCLCLAGDYWYCGGMRLSRVVLDC